MSQPVTPVAQDAATEAAQVNQAVDRAVAQGGAYEVLRRRLSEQGERLRQTANTLSQRRLQEFGDSRLEAIGRLRIRTENNCIGRDIVPVGDLLLFGYNVFIGLKTTTRVEDVFGLYQAGGGHGRLRRHAGGDRVELPRRCGIRSRFQRALRLLQGCAPTAARRGRQQAACGLPDRCAQRRRARVPLGDLQPGRAELHRHARRA